MPLPDTGEASVPRRIGAVVLAAGASTRMGSPKQLILRDGEPLVRRAVVAAVEAGAQPVVVVLGADASIIAPELAGIESVETVMNRDWASGLASSLAAGLRAVTKGDACDAALVTLADQPLVDAAALRRLMISFDDDHRIVASAYEGTLGVPAVFGREHFAELMTLTGDAGAGGWLRSRSAEVTSVALDDAAFDIDTPADLHDSR